MYIALGFVPELLSNDAAVMKAVVAKLFHTSWVVAWAPGQLADVALEWQQHRWGWRSMRNLGILRQAELT